jgi:LysR family glycine cleavage system transcriptional activator
MRRAPSLSSIEAFLAVVECEGLKGAAERLCLSPSAVTRRIQALERHVGARLFDRSRGRMALSAAGRALAERLRPAMLGFLDALHAEAESAPVRLRVSRSVAGLWLAPRLARLSNDVSLELRSDLAPADLLADAADLGIFFGDAPLAGLISEELLPIELSVVCAPRLADGRAAPMESRDVSDFTLLDLAPHFGLWRRLSSDAHASRAFDGIQAMYEAAASGLGLAHGLHPLVEPYLADGRLIELPWIKRAPMGAYRLFATRTALRSKKVAKVSNWLKSEAARGGATRP